MSCKVSGTWICSSVVLAFSITHFYLDRYLCRGAAHIRYLKGATLRGAEQNRWNVSVIGILDWDRVGKSGTDQRRVSQSGTDQVSL